MLPILEGLKEKGRNRSRRRRSSVVSSQGSGPMIRDVVGNGRSRRRMSMEHARRVSLDMTTLLVDRLPPPHCRLLDLVSFEFVCWPTHRSLDCSRRHGFSCSRQSERNRPCAYMRVCTSPCDYVLPLQELDKLNESIGLWQPRKVIISSTVSHTHQHRVMAVPWQHVAVTSELAHATKFSALKND